MKIKKTNMVRKDENVEGRQEPGEGTPPVEPEAVTPDEVIQPMSATSKEVGRVVWPKERAGEIRTLEKGIPDLKADQKKALATLEQGQLPAPMINHPEIGERFKKVQIAQLKAMEEAFKARTKADEMGAIRDVSEFNRERLKGYAEAVGNGSKSILTGVGEGVGKGALGTIKGVGGAALWVLRKGGKAALVLSKDAVLTVRDILYDLWGTHKKFREQYPNSEA